MAQQPDWPDAGELDDVLRYVRRLPPLVFAGEARRLQQRLAEAAEGRAFVLQAGDCAESFADFSADSIRDKLKIILQMAVVLTYGTGLPVVKVGRIAGQFAKPRSRPTERNGGVELPAFRGHAVNGDEFDAAARRPDPARLIRAYQQSASTLNLLRALTTGGFADLRRIHAWNQEFVTASAQGRRYADIAREVERAVVFMEACGVDLSREPAVQQVELYTSHEALLLGFEEALTRRDSLTGDWYDCSAHLLWVGDRTRDPQGAHVEFASGIKNPVAVKLGPAATADDVVHLCRRLDPDRVPGRLSFITRLGSARVENLLPPLVRAVREAGWKPLWICDPMHGNTTSVDGRKVRTFDDILTEIKTFFVVHQQEGTVPAGVHLELTHEAVTECVGALHDPEEDVEDRYQALCDPRLNARQSLELALEIAELLRS